MTKPTFEVKEGEKKATIIVPHKGGEISFVAPYFGPSTYSGIREPIDSAGLLRPTFAETVSLAHSATQNKNNKYAKQVLGILKNEWFWAFNDVRYEPKKGAFISDRNTKDIHVPFGFKTGEHSLEELVKNPFVLALAEGEEGAEKLAKIVEFFKQKSYVWSFDEVEVSSIQNTAAGINSGRSVWFMIDGPNIDVNDGHSCAFGLVPYTKGYGFEK